MFADILKSLMPANAESADHKDDYPPDEEMSPAALKLVEAAWSQNTRSFDDLNHAADQVNPSGLTKEPDMFEDAYETNEEPKASKPMDMDLD